MGLSHRIGLSATVILLAGMACASTPDPGAISTSAAQTVIAGFTQNVPKTILAASQDADPTFTLTPGQSISDPVETYTETPVYTPSPLIPLISVSVPTNCRNGPGKIYDMQGALLVGEFAEVYGSDPTNHYWYIHNPDGDPEFCWVWGKYATLIGPIFLLPVFTPPPTPTSTVTASPTLTLMPSPAFKAEYASLDTCNGSWWVEVQLKNKGTAPLKSVNISIRDKFTDIELVNLADGFLNMDGCLTRTTKDTLVPDDTYLLSSPAFNYDLTGHELKVMLTLCSDTGQKGACATNKINITP